MIRVHVPNGAGEWFRRLIGLVLAGTLTVSGLLGGDVPRAVAAGDTNESTLTVWGNDASGQGRTPQAAQPAMSVAAGQYHSLALKSDGTVVGWGDNGGGQVSVPEGLSGVVGVAAGFSHSLAVKSDGTVVAWGNDSSGQVSVPEGLSGVVAVAAGGFHSLALKSDGTVVGWGDNGGGQVSVPEGLSGVVAIAGGEFHSLAAKEDGTVVAWGSNDSGQVSVPEGLSGVVAVAAGRFHSLALKSDGTVTGWGHNSDGQLSAPEGLSGVVAIAAGEFHSLALQSDGTVTAWGDNRRGQLSVLEGLSGVVAITAGQFHSLAVTGDGTVTAWGGDNLWGQVSVPQGASGVVAIAAGEYHSLALESDGTVTVWGRNDYGQLNMPSGLSEVVAIAAGGSHNLALKKDGTVLAWGYNVNGQASVPVGLSGVVAIAAGKYHSLAVKEDGTVTAWGFNGYGQTSVPEGLSGVVAVAAGGYHSLALKEDGTVVAWGSDRYGQVSVLQGLSGVVAIAAGEYHSLALTSDGTVTSGGNSADGQANIPVGLSGAVAIAAGKKHSLALKSDGTVVAWGDNSFGQKSVPDGLSGVIAIAAGAEHSLALSGSTAPTMPLAINTISTPTGGNAGDVTLTVYGTGFQDGAIVKLARTGDPEIVGVTQHVLAPPVGVSSIVTTFDLTGKPLGVWDVVVVNPDSASATLPGGFTIVERGGPPLVTVDVRGPSFVRVGRVATHYVVVRNESPNDVDLDYLDIYSYSTDSSTSLFARTVLAAPGEDPNLTPSGFHRDGTFGKVPAYGSRVKEYTQNMAEYPACKLLQSMVMKHEDDPLYRIPMSGPYAQTSDFWEPRTRKDGSPYEHEGVDLQHLGVHRGGPILAMGAGIVTSHGTGDGYGNVVEIDHGGGLTSLYAHLERRAVSWGDYVKVGQLIGWEGDTGGDYPVHLHWEIRVNGHLTDPMKWLRDHTGREPRDGKAPGNWSLPFMACSVTSWDPNDKVGPSGSGEQRYLHGGNLLPYQVFFENKPDATAPAQDVVITDQLDPSKVDLDSFALRAITFGDQRIVPPDGLSEYSTDVDLRPANNLLVRITAGLNQQTGMATWRFTSIDPDTGLPPTDAMAGFLPPNLIPPQGEGSVSFTVEAKNGLPTGTEIRNHARIVFDTNDPIDTPEWLNTIDDSAPSSHVLPLPPLEQSNAFDLEWTGGDTGSGLRYFTIWVSEDNGPYEVWLPNTTAMSASFIGLAGKTYRFISSARDGAGNVEALPADPDATTVTAEDLTAPVITPVLVGTAGPDGWYTADVPVAWWISDGESLVTTEEGCDPTTVISDTTGTTFTCTATSAGGTASQSVTVKRDATNPTVVWDAAGPAEQGSYPEEQVPPAPTCSDAMSGVADCAVTGYDTSVGTHTVSVTATDNAGNTSTEARSYTVTAVNHPPTVGDIPDQTLDEGTPFATMTLDDYVTDPDNTDDQMSWTWVGDTELTVTITGRVATVTAPDPDWNGSETIAFTATDLDGAASSDQATFTVTPVNDPPVADAGPDQTVTAGAQVTLDGSGSSDIDGDPLSFSWAHTGGESVTLDSTHDAKPRFTAPNSGDLTFELTVDDGQGGAATDIVTVRVTSPSPSSRLYVGSSSSGQAGDLAFADEDILVYDNAAGTWAMFFDGSDVGLAKKDVDAFDRLADGSLLMSFDTDVNVPGVGKVDDSDIVRFTPTSTGEATAGTWSWYFDGSDVSLSASSEDVDAFTLLADGRLVISTTGEVKVPGVVGSDEDLLVFTPTQLGTTTNGSWALYFDGSDVDLTRRSEQVGSVSVAADGTIYLTTAGTFDAGGVSGDATDIIACTPGSLGAVTHCAYSMYWDGSAHGFASRGIDSLSVTG